MESYNESQITRTPSYEFNSIEERVIGDLAQKMRFVSYFLLFIGFLQIFAGLFRIAFIEQ